MRIALTCTEKLPVPPIAGGAVQLYIDGILPYLSREHDITVFSIQYPGLPESETVGNVKHIRLPGGTNEIYLNSLKKALDDSFDLIHVFNRPRYIVELMRLLPKARFSLSLHNEMFMPEKISDEDGLQLIERVEFINTVSKYIADTVKFRFPSAERKLRVVYSGVDTEQFKPVWSEEGILRRNELKRTLGLDGYKVVLFVGRLSVKKGVHVLIKAMEKVMAEVPKTALVIVGSKWYGKNESDEYSKSLKTSIGALKGPVRFTGFLPPSEVCKYYCIGDVFVCPSQWNEPLARVHYEAMAAGLPIITTDRGGNAEVVRGKGNGYVLTDYSNPIAMADKITAVLNNPYEALKMGGKGRLMAELDYSWERVAKEIFPDSVLNPNKAVLAKPAAIAKPAASSGPDAPAKHVEPAEHAVSSKSIILEIPAVFIKPAASVEPDTLVIPAVPVKPHASAEPGTFAIPAVPVEQIAPAKPVTPSEPATAIKPSEPVKPATPVEQDASAKPAAPPKKKTKEIHFGWNRHITWFGE